MARSRTDAPRGYPDETAHRSERLKMLGFEQDGGRWTVIGADALRAEFYRDDTRQRATGLVRNGRRPPDGPGKKVLQPWPVNGGPVQVMINNSNLHWAFNEDCTVPRDERLMYPNFPHRAVTLEVIDYSQTPGATNGRREHVGVLLADLVSSGYTSPTTEEAAHFALQYEVPHLVHIYVGTNPFHMPRYPDLDCSRTEHDSSAPFMPVLRSGAAMEVWHVDEHESFRDLHKVRFLVKPPQAK